MRLRDTDNPVCTLCERPRSDGERRFVAGPAGVYICEWCVELCVDILEQERERE